MAQALLRAVPQVAGAHVLLLRERDGRAERLHRGGSFSLHRLSYVRSSHVQGDRVLEIGIEYAAWHGGQQPQYPFSPGHPLQPGTPLSLASGGAPAAPLLRVELMAPSVGEREAWVDALSFYIHRVVAHEDEDEAALLGGNDEFGGRDGSDDGAELTMNGSSPLRQSMPTDFFRKRGGTVSPRGSPSRRQRGDGVGASSSPSRSPSSSPSSRRRRGDGGRDPSNPLARSDGCGSRRLGAAAQAAAPHSSHASAQLAEAGRVAKRRAGVPRRPRRGGGGGRGRRVWGDPAKVKGGEAAAAEEEAAARGRRALGVGVGVRANRKKAAPPAGGPRGPARFRFLV